LPPVVTRDSTFEATACRRWIESLGCTGCSAVGTDVQEGATRPTRGMPVLLEGGCSGGRRAFAKTVALAALLALAINGFAFVRALVLALGEIALTFVAFVFARHYCSLFRGLTRLGGSVCPRVRS
jgi:hypothetical protein